MEMTREQFIEKYGHIKVVFYEYWKYDFMYRGDDGHALNPIKIKCGYTGQSEIYKHHVEAGKEYTLSMILPSWAIAEKRGEETDEFYDF